MPDAQGEKVVLRLTVKNHPGAMSHICSLFSRRAFNLDALLCFPEADGKQSIMWLLVAEDERLEQVVRQLEKLEDVTGVAQERHSGLFDTLAKFVHGSVLP